MILTCFCNKCMVRYSEGFITLPFLLFSHLRNAKLVSGGWEDVPFLSLRVRLHVVYSPTQTLIIQILTNSKDNGFKTNSSTRNGGTCLQSQHWQGWGKGIWNLSLAWATELDIVSNNNRKCFVEVSCYFEVFFLTRKGSILTVCGIYTVSASLNCGIACGYNEHTGKYWRYSLFWWCTYIPQASAFGSLQSQMIWVLPLLPLLPVFVPNFPSHVLGTRNEAEGFWLLTSRSDETRVTLLALHPFPGLVSVYPRGQPIKPLLL